MHISVKELWEAWLRSEVRSLMTFNGIHIICNIYFFKLFGNQVHNWTIEQTTDWLAQSVQLPQYVDLFKQHKVSGAALPR